MPFPPASSLLRAARATWDYDGACPRGVRDREHDEQWAGPAGERVGCHESTDFHRPG
ncbi:MAG: hypothetical protein U1F59_00310 [Candidatus Competibacteraceae bacterium]